MSSMLKITVSLLSTLAAANLLAQCGPQGCGWGGNYSNQGYSDQQYYDGGYDQNQGYQRNYPGRYYERGYDQNQGYNQGNYPGRNRGYSQGNPNGGWGQGQTYHDGVYGYDQPMDDHPVYDNSGQHIKYYGKPGPDYNAQGMQPGAQPGTTSAAPASGNPAQTSYNETNNNGWYNVADASDSKGGSGPVAPGHTSDSSLSEAKKALKNRPTSKPTPPPAQKRVAGS